MKKILLTLIISFVVFKSEACSCGYSNIIDAYSTYEFIGIVEFKTLNRIENDYGVYESTFEIKELFKGKREEKIYIQSMERSSCSFLPKKNVEYLILAYKQKGKTMISFCSAQEYPKRESLTMLRKIKSEKVGENITQNIRLVKKYRIDNSLFEKNITGFFLYKVHLKRNFKIKKIIPQNENAKNNFSEKIIEGLKNTFEFKKDSEETKVKKKKMISYIILNWQENYENKQVLITPHL